ncbi:Uncharacterized protein Fot_24919 [Forsythia ovata]|uniref:Exophilin 5 n=1 Tax=Forsythia ovata TaxID=205694 RepID=A0ABD1U7J4_9LAMI
MSSKKKFNRGSEQQKKTHKNKKFTVKQGNKLNTSSIIPTDIERSIPYTAELYDDGDSQRVEDSDDDFLSNCNVRSPRLKMDSHRKMNDVSNKQNMSTTFVRSTSEKEHDRSKGEGIINVLDKNISLGVSGDGTPSKLNIMDQHAASVTPVLRRSPNLKFFQNDGASSSRTAHPKNAIYSLSRAYQSGDIHANIDGPSCFHKTEDCRTSTHQPTTKPASNQQG